MINEIAEFNSYIGKAQYSATSKRDNSYLGRFTYGMLLDFEGLSRVLTIIARGYMWEDETNPDIEKAKNALLAWCSIPERKSSGKEEWQFGTDFSRLNNEFSELVDKKGNGWFCRHVQNIISFVLSNPDMVMKQSVTACEKLKSGFDREWRKKVLQMQIPLYDENTKGAWILCFEDVLAEALSLGPLKNTEVNLPRTVTEVALDLSPKEIPQEVILTLLEYYYANKYDDSEWVILPVTNFDAYFGSMIFSKKWLGKLPEEIFQKQSRYGVCKIRVVNTILTEPKSGSFQCF